MSNFWSRNWEIVVAIAMIPVLIAILYFAVNINEQNECHKWAYNAKTLNNFYLTAAEAEQCNYWHIEVKAPTI